MARRKPTLEEGCIKRVKKLNILQAKIRGRMVGRPDELILLIGEAKRLASTLNRFRTYGKLDDAEKEAGYELADIMTGKQLVGDVKWEA